MRFDGLSFGSIRIDGATYAHDVVVDRGRIRRRKKKPSRKFREQFGHTPLSTEEKIPWRCHRLIVGTGNYSALPVMDDVKAEARHREVEMVIVPTAAAIKLLNERSKDTNAILHVTC